MDHKVTGWPAASSIAAAGGGARGERGTAGEKEGGGACEHRELTSELGERSGRPENERVAGIVPGGGGRG